MMMVMVMPMMMMMTMINYLEHALLNLMESVKVEEETSNMMQLFTANLNLLVIILIVIISKWTHLSPA